MERAGVRARGAGGPLAFTMQVLRSQRRAPGPGGKGEHDLRHDGDAAYVKFIFTLPGLWAWGWCSPLCWRPCRTSGMFSRGPPLVAPSPRRAHARPSAPRTSFLSWIGQEGARYERRLLAGSIDQRARRCARPRGRGKAGLLRRLLRNPAQGAMSLLPHAHAWRRERRRAILLEAVLRVACGALAVSRSWPFSTAGPVQPRALRLGARGLGMLPRGAGVLWAPWRAPVGISSRRGRGEMAQDPPVPRPGACARRAWPVPESPRSCERTPGARRPADGGLAR